MNDSMKYNPPLTAGRLKDALRNVPDDVLVNVLNDEGQYTANVLVWFEDMQTRKFVDLMGYKPYRDMTPEEEKKCRIGADISVKNHTYTASHKEKRIL